MKSEAYKRLIFSTCKKLQKQTSSHNASISNDKMFELLCSPLIYGGRQVVCPQLPRVLPPPVPWDPFVEHWFHCKLLEAGCRMGVMGLWCRFFGSVSCLLGCIPGSAVPARGYLWSRCVPQACHQTAGGSNPGVAPWEAASSSGA